jgi:hypothetical protein
VGLLWGLGTTCDDNNVALGELVEKGAEDGKSLMLRKVLLKPEPKIENPMQRKSLFRTTCKTKYRVCKVIISSGSTDNLLSIEMVEKLELETIADPNPYKFSWLQKGHQVMVTKQCLVEFKIGGYRDEILCDVIPMDVCHVFLEDHGSLTEISFMMGEKILTPWRRMA